MKRSTDHLLTLGMALTTDRRAMEQRVRGVFARKKSAKGVLALSALLVIALGFAAFTTACQATNGLWRTNIAGRVHLLHTSEPFEQIAAGKPAKEGGLNLPQRVDEEVSDLPDGMHLSVHAPVTGLRQSAYPVYLLQNAQFKQAEIDSLSDILAGNAPLVQTDISGGKPRYTRSELLQAREIYTTLLTDKNWSNDLMWVQQQIDEIDLLLQDAPDAVTLLPDEIEVIHYAGIDIPISREADFYQASGRRMTIQAYYTQEGSGQSDLIAVYPGNLYGGVTPDKEPIDATQAEEHAKQLLDQLGIRAVHAKFPPNVIDGDDHYAINYAGIGDAIEVMGGVIGKAGGTLRGDEMLTVQYDAQGLYSFSWQSRRHLIGCVNANVPLLPFEQVYQSFLNEARKQNLWKTTVEWNYGVTYQGVDLSVSEFSLAFTTVACGADNSLCYVIPVWRVFGRLQGTTPTGTRESTSDEAGIATQSDSLLMMINAIDGTVLYADDGGASGR
ncbi:MAG: DUF6034 family protein [Christensenella sp.]|nr:DUF6034 family protein [Christensenella sp.]